MDVAAAMNISQPINGISAALIRKNTSSLVLDEIAVFLKDSYLIGFHEMDDFPLAFWGVEAFYADAYREITNQAIDRAFKWPNGPAVVSILDVNWMLVEGLHVRGKGNNVETILNQIAQKKTIKNKY